MSQVNNPLVSGLAHELVGAGIGTGVYASSGVSIQPNFRRDFGNDVVHVILRESGGLSFPRATKEEQGIQVLVDAPRIDQAQQVARRIYELWEEVVAVQVSGGHELLWLRAIAPPQALSTGPDPSDERFQFSVNFNALVVKN